MGNHELRTEVCMDEAGMDDVSDIAAWYDHGVEEEESRLELHQLEYDLTRRFLTRYLPPTGSILEIGAATGRYTLALCRLGYSVTAVDFSPALLDVCQRRLAAERLHGNARFVVADARDLRAVADRGFDAVLLMGPLYHLIFEEDRREAIRQAKDRLRCATTVLVLSRLGIIGDTAKRMPAIDGEKHSLRIEASGRCTKGGAGLLRRVSGIRSLHGRLNQTLVLSRASSRRSRRTMTATTSSMHPSVICGSTCYSK
jgi:SAM-dependent methyltransferase